MKLWLISQSANGGYDTYDSAVVVADTAEAAQRIHPNGTENPEKQPMFTSWASPRNVSAEYLGPTDLPAGEVVCASFNAG